MDMSAYIYIKQRKITKDSWAVFFDIHKWFLIPDNMDKQAAESERMLQSMHYNGKKKGWDNDKYVALWKEQNTMMESLANHGYSGTDDATKVYHFFQGMKRAELEAMVNVVNVQWQKYGKDFDAMMSYIGQMVMKKGYNVQPVHIT